MNYTYDGKTTENVTIKVTKVDDSKPLIRYQYLIMDGDVSVGEFTGYSRNEEGAPLDEFVIDCIKSLHLFSDI